VPSTIGVASRHCHASVVQILYVYEGQTSSRGPFRVQLFSTVQRGPVEHEPKRDIYRVCRETGEIQWNGGPVEHHSRMMCLGFRANLSLLYHVCREICYF
jgi:hypothetical protein